MRRSHDHDGERPRRDVGVADLPMFDAETVPLCDRCAASFRAPDDTLCTACRVDVDGTYADLPGAEP